MKLARLAMLLILIPAAVASADVRQHNVPNGPVRPTYRWYGISVHALPHGTFQPIIEFSHTWVFRGAADIISPIPGTNPPVDLLHGQVVLAHRTPVSGLMIGRSPLIISNGWTGFSSYVQVRNEPTDMFWECFGFFRIDYAGQPITISPFIPSVNMWITNAAHTPVRPAKETKEPRYPTISPPEEYGPSLALLDPGDIGGVDLDGGPIWNTEPAVRLEMKSKWETDAVTGDVTLTYYVQNFTTESWDFSIDEVKTPSFPTGWSGTVAPLQTVSTSFTVDSSVQIYEQNVQAYVDVGDKGGDEAMPGKMFTADGYDSWSASVAAPTAQLVSGSVDVTFLTSGHDLDTAYLARVDGTSLEYVSSMGGPIVAGTHTLSDDSPGTGLREYVVMIETGPNGAISVPVSITVP